MEKDGEIFLKESNIIIFEKNNKADSILVDKISDVYKLIGQNNQIESEKELSCDDFILISPDYDKDYENISILIQYKINNKEYESIKHNKYIINQGVLIEENLNVVRHKIEYTTKIKKHLGIENMSFINGLKYLLGEEYNEESITTLYLYIMTTIAFMVISDEKYSKDSLYFIKEKTTYSDTESLISKLKPEDMICNPISKKNSLEYIIFMTITANYSIPNNRFLPTIELSRIIVNSYTKLCDIGLKLKDPIYLDYDRDEIITHILGLLVENMQQNSNVSSISYNYILKDMRRIFKKIVNDKKEKTEVVQKSNTELTTDVEILKEQLELILSTLRITINI